MDEESFHVIRCTKPGLSCCQHRLVATGRPEANVLRLGVWCMKWRENHMKDKIFRACDEHYAIKEDLNG